MYRVGRRDLEGRRRWQFSQAQALQPHNVFDSLTTLQRPSHIFIASLASTDLLLGLTVMVPRLVHELAGSWIFGFLLCQVNRKGCFPLGGMLI